MINSRWFCGQLKFETFKNEISSSWNLKFVNVTFHILSLNQIDLSLKKRYGENKRKKSVKGVTTINKNLRNTTRFF